jgi:hypothetical protein
VWSWRSAIGSGYTDAIEGDPHEIHDRHVTQLCASEPARLVGRAVGLRAEFTADDPAAVEDSNAVVIGLRPVVLGEAARPRVDRQQLVELSEIASLLRELAERAVARVLTVLEAAPG